MINLHKLFLLVVLAIFTGCNGHLQQFAKVAIQQLTAPVEMSKLVLTTHYDIIVTSRLSLIHI